MNDFADFSQPEEFPASNDNAFGGDGFASMNGGM